MDEYPPAGVVQSANGGDGFVTCPRCGASRPASIARCSTCGVGPAYVGPRCPRCGTPLEASALKCERCGFAGLKQPRKTPVLWTLLFAFVGGPIAYAGLMTVLTGGQALVGSEQGDGWGLAGIGIGLAGMAVGAVFFWLMIRRPKSPDSDVPSRIEE